MSKNILHSSKAVEWYTPPHIIELARKVMGQIDLDPASSDVAHKWIKSRHYFDKNDNGLVRKWFGSVWLNPPYSKKVANSSKAWSKKLLEEYENERITEAVVLLRPAISAKWFNTLSENFIRCETFSRIRFIDANGIEQKRPAHGNVLFYVGKKNNQAFAETFAEIGIILAPFNHQ